MLDLLFQRESPLVISRDMHEARLNMSPSHLAITAKKGAFLFQAHDLGAHTMDTLAHTHGFITYGTTHLLTKSPSVITFHEDASTRHPAIKRKVAEILRTGTGVEKHLDEAIAHGLSQLEQGNGEAGYQAFMDTIYLQLRDIARVAPGLNENQLSLVHEHSPKIFRPGDRTFQETGIFDYPLDLVQRRLTQIYTSAVVRDIALTSQMFRQFEQKKDAGFFLVRGTNHLGMLTFMRMMAESRYPQMTDFTVDVDEKRLVIADDLYQPIVLPLLWNRKFWQDVIEAYPDILELTSKIRHERDLNRLFSAVRKVFESEPWGSYLQHALHKAKQGGVPRPESLFPVILSQEDFS